jgi:hypothetical protein
MLRYNIRTGVRKIKTKTATSFSIAVLGIAGLGSSLAFIPALTHAAAGGNSSPSWHVGYYNPSGRALSFGQAQNTSSGLASLNFTNQPNTALLVTDQGSQRNNLLGDLSNKSSVSASFTISGSPSGFNYYGEGTPSNACGTPANVRLFFETSNAGGFDETHYWWSNTLPNSSAILSTGTNTIGPVSLDGVNWSDFNGHFGSDSAYSSQFTAAKANVTSIGLSFGGGCFFENGVGTTNGSGTFTLNSYTVL